MDRLINTKSREVGGWEDVIPSGGLGSHLNFCPTGKVVGTALLIILFILIILCLRSFSCIFLGV